MQAVPAETGGTPIIDAAPRKPKLIPAVARLDKPCKKTKRQKLAEARRIAAWKKHQSRKDDKACLQCLGDALCHERDNR